MIHHMSWKTDMIVNRVPVMQNMYISTQSNPNRFLNTLIRVRWSTKNR
jgi:hypothetical protein